MKNVYILFICDAWLSQESKRVLAVCTSEDESVNLAQKYSNKQGDNFTKNQIIELYTKQQTQGRSNNYVIEQVILNTYFIS